MEGVREMRKMREEGGDDLDEGGRMEMKEEGGI